MEEERGDLFGCCDDGEDCEEGDDFGVGLIVDEDLEVVG